MEYQVAVDEHKIILISPSQKGMYMKISARHENLLKHTFIDYQQTSMVLRNPLIFNRAEGLYLWDLGGKRYFDAIGGIYVAVLGHCHLRVMDAMR